MKVVLFCGGLGTRLKEYAETTPKPMVPIGHRPIIWHLMKYYAHYGHRDFILCLGYRGEVVRQYFLNYEECLSNDFTLSEGGRRVKLHSRDIDDWTITFADTGLHTNLGQRLLAVERYLDGEDVFLANYTDGLSDLPLPDYLEHFAAHDAVASFLCVRPNQSFHVVTLGPRQEVQDVREASSADIWINGGFFVFRRAILDYIKEGEDLVAEPFQRLIRDARLIAYRYAGFWAAMDTFKDKLWFDDMAARRVTPWEVWKPRAAAP
jgi:glucose-1-phosphate cytidylyltransferase